MSSSTCCATTSAAPTPLYEARRLSASLGGARIFLKREDLAHTGAHKINNALGQALLARRMGKRRVIAETGAGQHGVATATVCALLGLDCDVYMGAEDMERQSLNVFRMQLLGATVRRVDAGARTLKDAINEAMRDWVTNVARQLLPARLGARAASLSADGARVPVGDRPRGARAVPRSRSAGCPTRSSPASAAAATRWASSTRSSPIATVRLIGVEAGGHGITPGQHAARFAGGSSGVLQGTRSYVLQDAERQHRADAFDLGRPRLRRRRSRARLAPRLGPRRVCLDRRRRGARRVSAAGAGGGHPAGARIVARDRLRLPARPSDAARIDAAREPVGPRRQGRAQRAEGAATPGESAR